MTDSSLPTTRLPPARVRTRSPEGAPLPTSPVGGVGQGTAAPTPSLIGDGPGQYLLGCENRSAFNGMKGALDEDFGPVDAIERMWVDEIVDLSWDLHRLRNTRRAVVEKGLVDKLVEMVTMTDAGMKLMEASRSVRGIVDAARGCAGGDAQSYQWAVGAIGADQIEDAFQQEMQRHMNVLERLETSIHATSRLRDAIVTRLYIRRAGIADGRIISGRAL